MPAKPSLRWVTIGALLLVWLSMLPAKARAAGNAAVEILSIDPAGFPLIDATVQVRDARRQGVKGLDAADFVLEEAGRVVASELLRVTSSTQPQPNISVALVIDQSVLFDKATLTAMQSDAMNIVAALFGLERVEVALFVPRSTDSTEPLLLVPFSAERAAVDAGLQALTPRPGRTDFYNAVATAVSMSADRAAAREGPAYVFVLGDGLDTTSIVGSGATGANEAARLAESHDIRVFAWGYGKGISKGGAFLRQVADRSAGVYQLNPDEAAITEAVDQLRAEAQGGAYRVRYRSALTPDGQQHALTIRVRAPNATPATEAQFLLPRPWNHSTPTRIDVQVDAQAYPDVTLWTRPINRLQRTVPLLRARDVRVTVDGAALDVPLRVGSEPLDANDPAAAQSVALVVDTHSAESSRLRDMAVSFLEPAPEATTNTALFMPGIDVPDARFSHDRNALINLLHRLGSRGVGEGSPGATLLLAIQMVARDAETNRRPAHVVLFAGSTLAPGLQAQALALARDLGVTLHVLWAGDGGADLARLAAATDGRYLDRPSGAALSDLAATIAADRASRYRISFRSPFLADGRTRTLGLTLGEHTVTAPFPALITGSADATLPVSTGTQLLVLAATAAALLGITALIRAARRRRLRCPSCGQIKRAGWKSCLFCEYAAGEQQTGAPGGVPLDGFALQAVALLQPATPAGTPAADAEPPRDGLPSLQEAASESGAPAQAPVSAATDPSPAQQAVDLARSQTHTDFWGPLPADDAESRAESALEPSHAPERLPRLEPAFGADKAATASYPAAERLDAQAAPHDAGRSTGADAGQHTTSPGVAQHKIATEPSDSPVTFDDGSRGVMNLTGSHTDFWGSVAPTVAVSEDRR